MAPRAADRVFVDVKICQSKVKKKSLSEDGDSGVSGSSHRAGVPSGFASIDR